MHVANIVARPDFSRLPNFPLPIYVRSTGVYRVDGSWRWPGKENQAYVQVFWGIAGRGTLTIEDSTFTFGAGDVAFKLPHERHAYSADSGLWELRWVTFDGDGAAAFMQSYGYPRLIRNAGPCPQHLFVEIESGLREMTPFRQRKLISVMTEVLALAGGSDDDPSRAGGIIKRFIDLTQEQYANAAVNVNVLAGHIGVHRTTLARLFKERMMISPREYLLRLRMQHALALLRESDLPIAEIADKVGIPDPTYFCRCVRRAVGIGPREYRNAGTHMSEAKPPAPAPETK